MSNLLSQLENNEAVLLLYLAGELPREDCIEVQRMLERDSALRAQCAAMDRLVNRAAVSFGMDTALSESAPAERARQRLSPVFKQWAARRLSQPALMPEMALRRTPWFLYPLGAAAVILVGLAIFWSSIDPAGVAKQTADLAVVSQPDWKGFADEPAAEIDTVEASRQADTLIATFDESRQTSDGNPAGLAFAATELTRLQELDEQMDIPQPTVQ